MRRRMMTDSGVPASSFLESTFLAAALFTGVLVLGTFLVGIVSSGSSCCVSGVNTAEI